MKIGDCNKRKCNVIWLLKELKDITSGLDHKGNKHVTLNEAMLIFSTMKQRNNEPNDAYLTRFNSNVETLVSSGGKHLLCSPDLIEAVDPAKPTSHEMNVEIERLKAIIFIRRTDALRIKKMH